MIVDNRALPTDPVMLSQLPPLAVDSMTQIQLTEFIPQLVTLVTGRQHPLFGKTQYRPDWWPQDVSWSWPDSEDIKQSDDLKHSDNLKQDELEIEMLRKIVTSCYKHLDQENLLRAASLPQENKGPKPPVTRVLFEHDGNQNAFCSQENPKTAVTQAPPQEESPAQANNPIWVCFLCAKQFSNQAELMVHQDKCESEEEEAEAERVRLSKVLPMHVVPPPSRTDATSMPQRKMAQPVRMVSTRAVQSRVIHTRLVQRRRRRFRPEIYIPPPKDVFVKQLYLREKPRDNSAPVVKEEHVDSDCEIIDVEMVTTPVTPRTPKSLMSQLSRDAEGSHRKRQLSFSGGHVGQSDSDSGGESTTKEAKPAPAICSLLLNIDLSSPLGHRVKKQLKIDSTIPIISKADIYCRGYEKNNFFEKLRQREAAYPCTFKKKRKHAEYYHRMKFSPSQRREFMITQKTGLNQRSRKLLSQMEPCKVELEHMDPAEVKEWLRRKPRPLMPNYYQQARYAQAVFSRTSANARHFSNEVIQRAIGKPLCGPLSAKIRHMNQSLASLSKLGPGPKSYMITQVVKNPDGSETMRMVNDQNSVYRPVYRSQAAAAASRRKQNFVSERLERSNNEIEIIDLSSSDEEKEPVKQEVRKPIKAIHRANILSKVFKPSGSFQPRPSGSGLQNSPALSRPHPYVHIPTSDPKGFSIHSSPPGARTCKELQQRPLAVGGTRVAEFGDIGQGLVMKSPSPGPGLRISSVYSLLESQPEQVKDNTNFTTIRYQAGLLTPAGPRPPMSRPQGPRPQVNSPNIRPGPQGPPRMVRGPRPEPVKTSVQKMEVTGKNNDMEMVDVICIDDDDE